MTSPQRMFSSAKVVMSFTLLSRITGLIRDMALNSSFGLTRILDAFNYAFLVPNLFRQLFGEGALAAVFVPVFSQSLTQDSRESAWQLLSRVLALVVLVLAALTILFELLVLAIYLLWPGPDTRQLMLLLTATMLPFAISICLLALLGSALNCLGHFAAPAAAPVILNVCMIAAILLVGPALSRRTEIRIHALAFSVLLAAVLQLLLLWPVLRRHGVPLRLHLALHDPRLRRIIRLLVPMSLATAALVLSSWLDAQICTMMSATSHSGPTFHWLGRPIRYPLQEGAYSAITAARRVYQFPLGVLAISLATAAFPLFSRYAAEGQMDRLAHSISAALRLALFEAVPVGVVTLILAEPIVAALFERGRFDHHDTLRAAHVLVFYSLGIWAFCAQHIVLRGFYSLQDQLTPLRIAASLVGLNLLLNLLLIWHPALREAAFALSTSITFSIAVLVGLRLLSRRFPNGLGWRPIARCLAQTAAAAAAAGLAAWSCHAALINIQPGAIGPTGSKLLRCLVPLAAALIAYLAAAWLMRMSELRDLLGRRIHPNR